MSWLALRTLALCRDYALNRAREYYSLNNLIGYPKEERWVGRPTKRTNHELYGLLKARGAEFGFHSGEEASPIFCSLS